LIKNIATARAHPGLNERTEFSVDIFAAVGSNRASFRFWADMHPEKDAATLNKCKPQKV
jgi:hypothetical protein